ncbi:hypothetical protein BST97_04095 [Nonlabens spongiae]|uniref:Uncharacterized protein n=2 Tax=Nonlabens spongiae TaxID=331648 RepID=A0A1W6MP41_9FLAO|nr:hypothetical protein BST97_04095 [Nonlabens spongiae]
MGGLALSNKLIEKYFSYLRLLDDQSKKKLIKKLTGSMKSSASSKKDISEFFGAWIDDRTSQQINEEIRVSRVDKQDGITF